MPNVRAFRAGNWSDTNPTTSPWGTGGVLYAPDSNDDVWLNNFNVTLDTSATIRSLSNAAATSRAWKDGATTTATVGGTLTISSSANSLTASTSTGLYTNGGTANLISVTATSGSVVISSPIINASGGLTGNYVIANTSGATVSIANATFNTSGGHVLSNTGAGGFALDNCVLSGTSNRDLTDVLTAANGTSTIQNSTLTGNYSNSPCVRNAAAAVCNVINCTIVSGVGASAGAAIQNSGTLTITGSSISAGNAAAITQTTATTLSATNCTFTASGSANALTVNTASASVTLSGSFNASSNGFAAVYVIKFIMGVTPLAARTRYALSGSGTFVDMFTADNNLGQANPTDVRSGVTYASGNLTGRLTVPARGTVANGVTVGPNMPFTATRSGTTATATLAYSYPYSVGDVITVTGASNNEWNMDYTITEVVSGTSVRWTVPATHSATAGTGANAQTKGTATLEASAVAAAVWGAATSSLTTAGSIGERLKNAATVATTGEQLATALTAP